MASVHSGEEILPKASTPGVGCTNVTDRRHTTDRQTELRQQRPERNVVSSKTKTYKASRSLRRTES